MILFAYKALTVVLGIVAVVGPAGAIAGLIFAPAIVMPILTRIVTRFLDCKACIAASVLIIASVISFWIGSHDAYHRGVDDTIAKIARADAKLVARATAARGKLKDCQAQNKEWDQSTGGCR
jgi:nitrate/nitrite transporter NarK